MNKKVLILNGHQYYDVVAKGELTQTYIDKAKFTHCLFYKF